MRYFLEYFRPSCVISSVSIESSLFEASSSASSHLVGQPRVNCHSALGCSAVSSCVIVPDRRVIFPLIHSSRHVSSDDELVNPFLSTSGDHLVEPTSWNVV